LRVGNFLAADSADLLAHPPIHKSPDPRHRRNVLHAIAENQFRLVGRKRRGNEAIDLFGPMLAVGIENDHQVELPIHPMTETGFDRLAFTLVLFMNNHLRAGFARTFGSLIGGSVIDHQNVGEILSRPAHDLADVFLFVVCGNDRGHPRFTFRCHVERCEIPLTQIRSSNP
jgi:hypothetical protein